MPDRDRIGHLLEPRRPVRQEPEECPDCGLVHSRQVSCEDALFIEQLVDGLKDTKKEN